MLKRRLIILAAVAMASACSVNDQSAPPLSGPSELGTTIAVTATPDILLQDGQSQATIQIDAHTYYNQPVSGMSLLVETLVGGTAADFGTLSSKQVSTGSDGKVSLSYRAPAAPSALAESDTLVMVRVTPIGTNYGGVVARTVNIRLTRPGVILPPNGTPTASFVASPSAPRENDSILFDASASSDPDGRLVSYAWDFGDGRTDSGTRVFHSYSLAGAYTVVLTVTDDRGVSASVSKTVTVSSASVPKADFAFSPTTPAPHQNVNFNGSLSTAITGRHIVVYEWDFGDGSDHVLSPVPITAHAYNVVGTFVVVLNVTDDTGRTNAVAKSVTVAEPAP